ncbi:MAG: hypothetical protein WC763_07435 [Candidatus Paceibacterota bacterium]|jgi:hypothetical protein
MQNNRGIIKVLLFIIIVAAFLLVFFSKFAQYFKPSGIIDKADTTSYTGLWTQTNPLVDFIDKQADPTVTTSSPGGGTKSPYAGRVTFSGGSTYSYQPYEEYVTIRNAGAPVSITGWVITNAKGERPIETSANNYVYPVNDSATIGQGTEYLSPEGAYDRGPIVLKTGDTAIVTTGGPFIQFRMPIPTSFRENICLGYLDKDYPWSPSVSRPCPIASKDPDIDTMTDECYDYVRTISRCEDPERYDKERFDLQRTPCKDFMRERFTYQGCVTKNRASDNFSLKQWRVFLGKSRELYSNRHDTITLYDAEGRIVGQFSY